MGSVYRRRHKDKDGNIREGETWWIKYNNNGTVVREPTEFKKKSDAEKKLKGIEGDLAHGVPVVANANQIKFSELADAVLNDYRLNKYDSLQDAEARFRLHILPAFGNWKACQITTDHLTKYVLKRIDQGAKAATINRELELKRRAFRLGKKVYIVPDFPFLKESNVRKGFFERSQLEALCRHLPAYLIPVAKFGYITGWRHGEVVTLTLGHVHFEAGEIRLEVAP